MLSVLNGTIIIACIYDDVFKHVVVDYQLSQVYSIECNYYCIHSIAYIIMIRYIQTFSASLKGCLVVLFIPCIYRYQPHPNQPAENQQDVSGPSGEWS